MYMYICIIHIYIYICTYIYCVALCHLRVAKGYPGYSIEKYD